MTGRSNDDDLDEVEEITYAQPRGREAEGLEAYARSLEPGARLRAELLRTAVDWWRRRGLTDDALRCAQDACADGGRTWIDPRADLIGVLLDKQDARAEDLIAEVRRDLAASEDVETLAAYVGEELETAGRQREALRWYSIALADLDPNDIRDDETVLLGLLGPRARLRSELGLRPDRYDAAAARVQRYFDERNRARSGDWSADDIGVTVLWWPEPEFIGLLEHWPDLAAGYGDTPAGHRALSEQHLRRFRAEGMRVAVGAGVVAELIEHARSHGHDPDSAQARSHYAAELGRTGRSVPWPPGRNDRCWCGSGDKYKRCCGAAPTQPASWYEDQ